MAEKAWEQVLHHLERLLLDGSLAPGDHLPPERALAADLEVGRSSVREAVRVLEVLGLVRTATGSGPQSGAIIIARPSGGMSLLLRLQVAAQGFPVADIVRTRLVLETSIAAELAAGDADLTAARELLTAMDDERMPPAEFLALDARFHVALAEASGNTVLAAMMTGLRDAVEGYVLRQAPTGEAWTTISRTLRAEHAGVLEAIDAGRADDASRLIHAHITDYHAATT